MNMNSIERAYHIWKRNGHNTIVHSVFEMDDHFGNDVQERCAAHLDERLMQKPFWRFWNRDTDFNLTNHFQPHGSGTTNWNISIVNNIGIFEICHSYTDALGLLGFMKKFTTGHSASKTFKETNVRILKIVEHGYATLLAGLTIKDEPIVRKNIHHPYQIKIPLDKCSGASITKTLVEAGYDIIGTPMMPIPTRRNTQLYNSLYS